MIFVADEKLTLQLDQFGLMIPLSDLRYEKINHWIEEHQLNKYSLEKREVQRDDLLKVHSKQYIQALESEGEKAQRLISQAYEYDDYGDPRRATQPLTAIYQKAIFHVEATFLAMKLAREEKTSSFVLGGGMHHARRERGAGFCLLSDIVIASKKLQSELSGPYPIAVIDVDAHQGDGTAELCRDDSSLFTLSIHMRDGWPFDEMVSSDLDIPISQGEEHRYLEKLEQGLSQLPSEIKHAVIVLGADPWEHDELKSASLLKLSSDQMLKRDLLLYEGLQKKGIRQTYTFGGGYGKKSFEPYLNFLKATHSFIV